MSEKRSKIACGVLFFLFLCPFLWGCYMTAAHEHEWRDNGCLKAKTCSICGDTDGEPPGHQWKGATCDTPKTCVVCGIKDGEPLGHDFNTKGVITVYPTCQAKGEKICVCSRCEETKTVSIPAIAHKAGDWQAVENTGNPTSIIEAKYCTVCGTGINWRKTTLPDFEENRGTGESADENGGSNGNISDISYRTNWGSGSDGGTKVSSGSESGSSTGGNADGEKFNTYDNESQQQTSASYVLNTRSMKFHHPSCRDVPKISPKNYATSYQSRSDLISQGYSSCGHCKP